MFRLNQIVLAGLVAVAGTALAGAVASAGDADGARAVAVAAKPAEKAPTVTAVPAWLKRDFALFRGSAKRGMPRTAVESHTIARFGLNRGLARRVAMGEGAIYVIPGSRGVCLDAAAVTTCADRRRALDGMLVVQSCLEGLGDATRTFALVPDGVERVDLGLRDGRVVELTPTRNVVAVATGVAPVAVTWAGLSDEAQPIDQAGGC
jgi:hypothetical protein